jgi:5-methylcytosine-specific restriction enzyme subunit McrC
MPQHFIISEYGLIRRACDYEYSVQEPTLSNIYISESAFDTLKRWALSANTEPILSFILQKGKECFRVKNHVGLIQTSDGTQIEVLPKIVKDNDPIQARLCLLKMLRYVPDLPFQTINQAHLQHAHLPIWEIFISAFVTEMEKLTQQGIQKSYVTVEGEQSFLRGKWLPTRQNYLHPETFYVSQDEFQADILPNRLLKTCLLFLVKRSQTVSNQTRLRQLRFIWNEVGESENIKEDFAKLKKVTRHFDRYAKALQWAKVLLQHQAWNQTGKDANESLLFPTERLFESYVARGFKNYLSDFEVVYQENFHFLVNEHVGKKQFKLRPDLVLRQSNRTLVLDMKWKWIEPQASNYGIEQNDLYQLYAYGKKYNATALYLIYPAHESFRIPLPPFHYDNNLTLTIIPFDLVTPLAQEMQKIKSYLNLTGLQDL